MITRFHKLAAVAAMVLTAAVPGFAQKSETKKTKTDSIPLYGYVYDRLTSKELPSTLVQILRPDSSFVSSAEGGYTFWKHNNGAYSQDSTSQYEIYLPRVKGDYIIKVSKEGYNDLYAPYRAEFGARTAELKAPKLYMSREQVKELEELTVKASKIKFYHKGDTIVYNADAFSLPEGSMLDALVQQMPGVEIKGNEIYVNGKFVESLLLNGKDFFKQDKAVAMQNIGAYAVKNVAVYEKNEESAELLGARDDVQKELVMDVRLKKDYMTGTAMNADAGYGTRGRYLGRLFGLAYTNNSRFSLYGNTNNMNISNRLDENGEQFSSTWDPGITARANAGIDYNLDNAMHTWEINGNADIHYVDVNDQVTTNAVQYLQATDNFLFSDKKSRIYKLQVSTNHQLKINRDMWNLRVTPSFEYNKRKEHADTRSATFGQEFDGLNADVVDNLYTDRYANLTEAIINRNLEYYNSNSHGYNGELALASKIKIPNSPDAFELKGNVRYSRNTLWGTTLQDVAFGDMLGDGLTPVSSLLQRRDEAVRPDYTLRLLGLARYYFTLPFGSLNASYEYIHTQSRKNSGLMLLESMAQGTMAEFVPGQLPMPDLANSYAGKTYKNQHHLKLIWSVKKKYDKGTLELRTEPSAYLERHDLFYTQGDAFVNPEKTFWKFNLEKTYLQWMTADNKLTTGFGYTLDQTTPDLLKMVDIPNTTDPMNIWLGNPDLKKSTQHRIDAFIRAQSGKHTRHMASVYATINQNDFANGYRYNSATGIREMKTYNVNGNNSLSAWYMIFRDLDKSGEWTLRNQIYGNLGNYSNMIGYDADPVQQKVRRYGFSEYLTLSMEKKIVTLRAAADYTFSRSVAKEPNPTRSNYGTRSGRFFGEVRLPFNVTVNTEFSAINYYGYIDDTMNRTVFDWNANLNYSILKGALRFGVKAKDILNQQKGLYMSADATGRTQTQELTLGRTILFTVAYKFHIKPKRH